MFIPTFRACSLIITAALLLAAAGCQQQKPVPPPPSAEAIAQQVANLREQYQKLDSSSIVGQIVDALPNANLVAAQVSVEDAAKIKVGTAVTFLDLDGNVINHGTVMDRRPAPEDHNLHIRYNDPAGKRAPHVNDVMLYVK